MPQVNVVAHSSWSPSDLFFAAVIAGVVGLIGHVIGRSNVTRQVELSRETAEQANSIARRNLETTSRLTANVKLAEMRQLWINNLRSEMTDFHSLCIVLDMNNQTKLVDIFRSGTNIELHMNPEDEDYDALKQVMADFIDPKKMSFEGKKETNIQYVAICQRILKREWDKLQAEVQNVALESASEG